MHLFDPSMQHTTQAFSTRKVKPSRSKTSTMAKKQRKSQRHQPKQSHAHHQDDKPPRTQGTADPEEALTHYLQHLEKTHRLRRHETTGDGNCLFRALAYHLTASEATHETYRARVVSYMTTHADDFRVFVSDEGGMSWSRYLHAMAMDGTYAGHLELVAFVRAFGVGVVVHQVDGHSYRLLNETKSETNVVHLLYYNHEHYDALEEMDRPTKVTAHQTTHTITTETEETVLSRAERRRLKKGKSKRPSHADPNQLSDKLRLLDI